MRVYFNHAGTSWPKPARVREAVAAAMNPEAEADWRDDFAAQHARVAATFGLRAEELLLTPGCTSALALALGDFDWRPGEAVLVDGLAHQALHGPALRLDRRGIAVEVMGSRDGALDLDALETRLARPPRVGLVALSMAANVTGALLPYGEVITLAHRHGTRVLLDAAQTVGWMPIDLPALGADMVAFGGHKGLQGPWGIGGLYVAEGVPMQPPRADAPPSRPGYCDGGSVDRPALAGLAAAVSSGPHDLERARKQVARLQEAIEAAGGTVVGPREPEARVPTVAFTTSEAALTVARALETKGLVVSGGRQCAPLAHTTLGTLPHGVVRMSVGPQTTDEELDVAVACIAEHLG